PWPRERLADLVDRLRAAGAAAIAFDVVFAEADRLSPRTLAAQWPLDEGAARALRALPDPDQRFAAAIRRAPVVLGFSLEHEGQPAASLAPNFRIATRGEAALSALPAFASATLPVPPLREAAAGLGAVSFLPDADGIVRRIPLLARHGDTVVASLATEALRVSLGERNCLATGVDGAPGLASLRVGRFQVPTEPNGEAWIHYARPRPDRYLPAWTVFE